MPKQAIDTLDPRDFIIIKGAKVHNLKNVDVAIPRNKMVVITGLSGSGKSSLAFDTLYAEGQRRYVESLSAYARQFLGRMNKPEVEYIKGIAPAIAIEQKVNTTNPRSTVGTSTEIYDYLKLLYARIGKTISPVSGKEVKRETADDVAQYVNGFENGAKVLILFAARLRDAKNPAQTLQLLLQQGFSRIYAEGEIIRIDDAIAKPEKIKKLKALYVIADRMVVNHDDEDNYSRIIDSAETAFSEGEGGCLVQVTVGEAKPVEKEFSNRFEADGITFEEPNVNLFTFNNPYGACKTCEGFGSVIGLDPDLVIPDKSLSIYEGAIAPWKGEKMSNYKDRFLKATLKFDFPVHRPYVDLTEEQQNLLWEGNKHFTGLNDFFKELEEQAYKIQYRVMLSRYRGKTGCPDCLGTRLRKDAGYVKVAKQSIQQIVLLPVEKCLVHFKAIKLNEHDQTVGKRLLVEIINRLQFLCDVGLGYLTLNRLSSTLSGGESQRINLAKSLGSSLVGSMYILDEPSIGLHPRDTERLIGVLKTLRDVGNTVIIVEHDREIMLAADELIDIGPEAGTKGGQVIFQGNQKELQKADTITTKYLSGKLNIEPPATRRKWRNFVFVKGARENNLKNIDVKFPLGVFTVVTGVSGSGKSSLIKKVLYPALKKLHGGYGELTGKFDKLEGNISSLSAVEFVDQNPIGKSSRSNPVTYIKAYDDIRELFASQQLAKQRAYKTSTFSFNVEGGRCEVCEGDGEVKIEMQFMADIRLECEACHGKRFKDEVLEVNYNGKNIYEVLELTVDEAIEFFGSAKKLTTPETRLLGKLKCLADVGLGYIHLGQSSSTLSGGEAQRIKLASFLTKGSAAGNILFIFDEPTTGLHFHDINKLLKSFDALIAQGHSIIVIEHNTDVIRCADWVIDLGAEGGDKGGHLIFEGTPEDLKKCKNSYTGEYI
jgi:excinuclease ABC subunit A